MNGLKNLMERAGPNVLAFGIDHLSLHRKTDKDRHASSLLLLYGLAYGADRVETGQNNATNSYPNAHDFLPDGDAK